MRGDRLITSAAALMPGNTDIVRLKKLSDFAKQMFLTETCSRIILQIDAPSQSEGTERLIDEMLSLLNAYYPDGETGLTGRIMSVYDISNAFHADLLRVNLITIGMIFVIILISFKSVLIPLILLLAIQGAAWINTSLRNDHGSSIRVHGFESERLAEIHDNDLAVRAYVCDLAETEDPVAHRVSHLEYGGPLRRIGLPEAFGNAGYRYRAAGSARKTAGRRFCSLV